MRKKLQLISKKYKISITIAIVIVCIGIISLFLFNMNSKLKEKEVKEKSYSLKYDSSWKLKEKTDTLIALKHNASKSLLKFELIGLEDEYQYSDIEDLMDEVLYHINSINKEYKLIAKKEDVFTSNQFKGYKMLYEKEKEQVMVVAFKKSDKLIMICYEAESKYFDILLDSVQNVIYNFNVVDEQFDIENSIKLETSKISYSSSKEVDSLLKDTKEYEIADHNYKVIYKIPSSFELSSFNSTSNYFNLKNIEKGQMTLTANIYNKNIYEYLDKENITNVYKNYQVYKQSEDCYDYLEQISKLESKFLDRYIYKNSYKTDSIKYNDKLEPENYKKPRENVELIYSLNKNHILVITLSASDVPITEELIKSIDIKEVVNYSSYGKSEVKEDFQSLELKRYAGYEKDKIDRVTIKVPISYREIDKRNNLYEERYFGLDYDEDKDLYDYVVHYKLTGNTIKDITREVDSLNKMFITSYGDYRYYERIEDIAMNQKTFIIYSGGYTNLGGIMFTNINRYQYYVHKKALFYKLNSGGYFIIEISGNGKEISNEVISQVTNFEIEIKDN